MTKEDYFNEFMGIITFMCVEKILLELIKDMRVILETKVEKGQLDKETLIIFDWYISNYKNLS